MIKYILLAIFTINPVFNTEVSAAQAKLRANDVLTTLKLLRTTQLAQLLTDTQLEQALSLLQKGEVIAISAYHQEAIELGRLDSEQISTQLLDVLVAGQQDDKGDVLWLTQEGEINRHEYFYEQDKQIFSLAQGKEKTIARQRSITFEKFTQALAEREWQSIVEMIDAASNLPSKGGHITKTNTLGKLYGILLREARSGNDSIQIEELRQSEHFTAEIKRCGHLYALFVDLDLDLPTKRGWLITLGQASGVSLYLLSNFINTGNISEKYYSRIENKINKATELTEEHKKDFLQWLGRHVKPRKARYLKKFTQALAEREWQSIVEMIAAASNLPGKGGHTTKTNMLGKIYGMLLREARSGNDSTQIEQLRQNEHFTAEIKRRGHLYALFMDLALPTKGEWLIALGEEIGVHGQSFSKFINTGNISERSYGKIENKLNASTKLTKKQKEEFLQWLGRKRYTRKVTRALAKREWQSITEIIATVSNLPSSGANTAANELSKLYSMLLRYARSGNDSTQIEQLRQNEHFTAEIKRRGHLYALFVDLDLPTKGEWFAILAQAIGVHKVTLINFINTGNISEPTYEKIENNLNEAIKLTEKQKEDFLQWLGRYATQRKIYTSKVEQALVEHDWQSIVEMIVTANNLPSKGGYATKTNELSKLYGMLLRYARSGNDNTYIEELKQNEHFTTEIKRRGHLYALFVDLALPTKERWTYTISEAIGVNYLPLYNFINTGNISERLYVKIENKLNASTKLTEKQKEEFLLWLGSYRKDS